MLAASDLSAVLRATRDACAALDANDPQRPNFVAALETVEVEVLRPGGKRRRHRPVLPHREKNLHKLRDGHRLKRSRDKVYAAFDELFNIMWPISNATGHKRNKQASEQFNGEAAHSFPWL